MHNEHDDEIASLLDSALDAVFRARVAAGDLADVPVPHEALDAALRADPEYQAALDDHRRVYDRLVPAIDGANADLLLALAAASTAVATASSEVGWRLAITACGGRS